jgi:hypothetical protein
MIPTVRLPGNFVGTDYEDIIWKKIFSTLEASPQEFKLCFYCDDSDHLPIIANSVSGHDDHHLRIKTTIKLWNNCKNERVFLDVSNGEILNSRFQCRGDDISAIINALVFIEDHFNFINSERSQYNKEPRRQKRNDSSTHDRYKT